MTEITQILSQIEQGDPYAAEHLLPLVLAELKDADSGEENLKRVVIIAKTDYSLVGSAAAVG